MSVIKDVQRIRKQSFGQLKQFPRRGKIIARYAIHIMIIYGVNVPPSPSIEQCFVFTSSLRVLLRSFNPLHAVTFT